MCEFPTHFSEFACPDLKLEFYWGFHSALKFHSNHLHYACLTPVIISIFSTTSSIEFGGKFRVNCIERFCEDRKQVKQTVTADGFLF